MNKFVMNHMPKVYFGEGALKDALTQECQHYGPNVLVAYGGGSVKKTGIFAAGVLFGTAGIKLLSSKDAKKLYTNGTAAVLRAKECVMKTATTIQENAEDIYEEAKAINEERAVKEEQEFEETQTEEITEEAVEETVAE